MKTDYRNIPVQKAINFAKSANIQTLMVEKMNLEEYIHKCDYSTENLTEEILDPNSDFNSKRYLIKVKCTILEKRGAAHEFLTIIKKEMEVRTQAYEERERTTR